LVAVGDRLDTELAQALVEQRDATRVLVEVSRLDDLAPTAADPENRAVLAARSARTRSAEPTRREPQTFPFAVKEEVC
jgi:hypothetical protein